MYAAPGSVEGWRAFLLDLSNSFDGSGASFISRVTVQTGANGHYSVTGLQYPYSNGQLFVQAVGYYAVQNVSFNTVAATLNVSLLPGGPVLRGMVRDSATGTPIAAASVSYGGTNTFQWDRARNTQSRT